VRKVDQESTGKRT